MKSKKYSEIVEKYKELHVKGNLKIKGTEMFKGYSLAKSIVEIKNTIFNTDSKTILDFGCGKAMYYFNRLNIEGKNFKSLIEYWAVKEIMLYDPAVEKFSKYPWKKVDGVICTDVLEHIPETDIIDFINDIFKLANKFVYFAIATVPSTKFFPNGENIHLCIKNENEWLFIFNKFKIDYPHVKQTIRFNKQNKL